MSAAPSTTAVQARIHAHERSVSAEQRKADGVHYTPAALARFLVEQAIATLGYVPQQICDPTCGAGSFLLAAADALADRGVAVQEIVEQRLFGGEIDPRAGSLAKDSLRAWAEQRIGRVTGSRLCPQVAVGDMLLRTPESWVGRNPEGWDLVIGNPPFLSQLATRTSRSSAVREAVQQRFGEIGVYADSASLFLLGALDMVCEGGVVVMVQPQSFLATRDTAAVRSSLLGSAKLRGIWASEAEFFEASVRVCAPVLQRSVTGDSRVVQSTQSAQSAQPAQPAQSVQVWWGGKPNDLGIAEQFVEPEPLPGDSWGPLFARAHGLPSVHSTAGPRLGEVATATAGFRDEFYALLDSSVDLGQSGSQLLGGAQASPLITVGMIDPGSHSWGLQARRFGGRKQLAPAADMDALARLQPRIAEWARARQVPKVLVATQTRIVEAVADPEGRLIPVTPTISVEPRNTSRAQESVWHLTAALLSPPVSARALSAHLGAGLSSGALRWSARSVLQVELPIDETVWASGAGLAQKLASCDQTDRAKSLAELGKVMCSAYEIDPTDAVFGWWLELALRAAKP
ncbi:Methyltransferase domain [Actinobacteria bacterium IMCC26207]|nr:Methyltransferase domain [Actinobacteria bacterium IMCC26207]